MSLSLGTSAVSQVSPASPPTSSGKRRRIFVVDDHPIFQRGLQMMLQSADDLTVQGTALSGEDALVALQANPADIVLVDLGLPGINGLEFIRQLRALSPGIRVLAISSFDEQRYAIPALKAGANGYIMKHAEREDLLNAVRSVLRGEVYVSPELRDGLIYKVACSGSDGQSPLSVLTEREMEVLELVGKGMSSARICEHLGVSIKTIESHRLHIKEKLRLRNAAELIRFAVQWASS